MPKNNVQTKNSGKWRDADIARWVLFGILCLAGAVFLIWKAHYGYGNRDESFYLTIPKRLVQGDALIAGEWHVSQLSGFLLYPLMYIYMLFNPSFEGAILHFRIFYVLFQLLCAVFLFWRLQRISKPVSVIAPLFFMLYAPFNIMAMSYNSLGIGFFALATVTFITVKDGISLRRQLLNYALAGVFFACAVLCCPYLAVLYFLYLFAVLIAQLVYRLRHKACDRQSVLSFVTLLGLTAGVAVMAVLFLLFVFTRSSPSKVIAAIPQIMNDPEHSKFSLLPTLKKFGRYVIRSNTLAKWCYIATGVLTLAALFDRKSRRRRAVYFVLAAAVTVVYALGFRKNPYINYLMMPLNLLGLISFFLCEKRPWKVFLAMFVPTLLYAYAVSASSNQGFYVISSVFSVGCICSIYFIYSFLSGYDGKQARLFGWVAQGAGIVAFAVVLVFAMQIRATDTFWDSDVAELNVKIESGVNRGIITRESFKNSSDTALADTADIRAIPEGNVLYFSKNTALYLMDEKRNAAFSAWMSIGDMKKSQINRALTRLKAYYEINPEKIPDVIYIDMSKEADAQNVPEQLGLEGTLTKCGSGYVFYREGGKK